MIHVGVMSDLISALSSERTSSFPDSISKISRTALASRVKYEHQSQKRALGQNE